MKSYTLIEQAKKLAEFLPPESADMYYFLDPTPAGNIYHVVIPQIDFGIKTREPEYNKGDIPCWSLVALLSLLPNNEHIETTISRGSWKIDTIEYLPNTWWCEYEDNESLTEFNTSADNPVDACYEMVTKLHELKLL